MNQIPTSTQWTLDAAGDTGRSAINSVFLIYCDRTKSKGTGFIIEAGLIVTNEHVVRGCNHQEVVALDAYGNRIQFERLILDAGRDLALLFPTTKVSAGLALSRETNISVGTTVTTWGHPLGYNGPNPLLSVGYVAGYAQRNENGKVVKHLVVNGAFNPGNSGGPLFKANDNTVVGIVVSKHAPISRFHLQAIEALSKNDHTGIGYTHTASDGTQKLLMESQIVADILVYFRQLTQVMIGEAVVAEELRQFLSEHGCTA